MSRSLLQLQAVHKSTLTRSKCVCSQTTSRHSSQLPFTWFSRCMIRGRSIIFWVSPAFRTDRWWTVLRKKWTPSRSIIETRPTISFRLVQTIRMGSLRRFVLFMCWRFLCTTVRSGGFRKGRRIRLVKVWIVGWMVVKMPVVIGWLIWENGRIISRVRGRLRSKRWTTTTLIKMNDSWSDLIS